MNNVRQDILEKVSQSAIAMEVARSLVGLFTVESYKKVNDDRGSFDSFYLHPTKTMASSLLIDREIIGVVSSFQNVQARVVRFIKDEIGKVTPRLHPGVAIVIHGDRRGNQKLESWGREQGIVIIPIYKSLEKPLPGPDELKRQIAWHIFSSDPFDITGPVSSDDEFYGRRNEALELTRQLEKGRVRTFLGIRKIGKTSIISRCVHEVQQLQNVNVIMIDCSNDFFFSLKSDDAIGYLATAINLAMKGKSYIEVSDLVELKPSDINTIASEADDTIKPIALIFDEVDYITPSSQAAPHWRKEFNIFWRKLRAFYQEAHRRKLRISLLVSGVSSMWFSVEEIDGIENSALHFIPEEYLSPFPEGASVGMIKNIGKRVGLKFNDKSASYLASICGNFPYWIRKSGSYLHKAIPVDSRPFDVDVETIDGVLNEYFEGEGGVIASVAIRHLYNTHPNCAIALEKVAKKEELNKYEKHMLEKYGLVKTKGKIIEPSCRVIANSLTNIFRPSIKSSVKTIDEIMDTELSLDKSEWIEELALINKRRNNLEDHLREFIRYGLKFNSKEKSKTWQQIIGESLPPGRKKTLSVIAPDEMMTKLFFKELCQIITKHWDIFQNHFGDKNNFTLNAMIINERPDAHANKIDKADIALYRRALDWFEKAVIK